MVFGACWFRSATKLTKVFVHTQLSSVMTMESRGENHKSEVCLLGDFIKHIAVCYKRSCHPTLLSLLEVDDQGCSHHFRSEGDKLFRGLLSDSLSSRIQLHLSLVAKEPHKHKQHSTRGLTSGPYNYILSKYVVKI